MELVVDVLQILNKIGKITIKGKGDLCPSAVSVSNIIIQNGGLKTEKISVSSEALDDGRLVSTIEIVITKIHSLINTAWTFKQHILTLFAYFIINIRLKIMMNITYEQTRFYVIT